MTLAFSIQISLTQGNSGKQQKSIKRKIDKQIAVYSHNALGVEQTDELGFCAETHITLNAGRISQLQEDSYILISCRQFYK